MKKQEKNKNLLYKKNNSQPKVIRKICCQKGGGFNQYRYNLSDEVLIKDNHIKAARDLKKLVIRASKSKKVVTVEIENIGQLRKILGLKFKRILFLII